MKLANPKWANILEWDYTHPGVLVLEHPKDFAAVVSDLSVQEAGKAGELVLSEKGQELSFPKHVLLVRDLWAVDLNQKKLLNGIYKQAVAISREKYSEEIYKLLEGISSLLGKLEQDFMFPLEWEEVSDALPLLKAYGVRLEEPSDLFERLLDYTRLSHEILHIKLLILVGVRAFFTKEECDCFCREMAADELPVLFVDGYCGAVVEGGKRLIIDTDRCELMFS